MPDNSAVLNALIQRHSLLDPTGPRPPGPMPDPSLDAQHQRFSDSLQKTMADKGVENFPPVPKPPPIDNYAPAFPLDALLAQLYQRADHGSKFKDKAGYEALMDMLKNGLRK